MSKFEKQVFENIDITRTELKNVSEALKKDEFRKLLGDYFDEVTDPQNRALYEREMIQLEKERGVDITFVHPKPGYVIKTSCDGEREAFLNICLNDLVGRPIPATAEHKGQVGTNWTVPHLLVPPKIDMDKDQQQSIIFDVIFHPETFEYVRRSDDFRKLVNDTALTGVEDAFDTKLDRNNVTYPKLDYKGPKSASVIRKSCEDTAASSELPFDIPNYPFAPLKKNDNTRVTKPRNSSPKGSTYTTPKYIIKHRKGVDYHECSNALDSKVNAATPSELVVEIDLPLLSSTEDAKLDVFERSLTLVSEKPSKYKLNISLPYAVDESNGSARFDKRKKVLVVTLPVFQKKFEENSFNRDDSGIESDQNHNRSSSDEDLSRLAVEVMSVCDDINEQQCDKEAIDFRTSTEVVTQFLSEDVHYIYPSYSLCNESKHFSIKVDVKNVEPSTVCHQFVFEGSGVHFKFSSLGPGLFPIFYAYCIKFPKAFINSSTLKVDVWDNNLLINLDLISCEEDILTSYCSGPSLDNLEELSLKSAVWFKNINLTDKVERRDEGGQSQVDQLCHRVSEVDINTDLTEPVRATGERIKLKAHKGSESSLRPTPVFARRSILKNSRSLSESNTDEYTTTWSSIDSSDNQDEYLMSSSVRKTVRFSEVISKKVFRAGSSILGQKHKNEKKARNRKKVMIKRRRSESETSEVSDYSEVSDMSEASDGCSSDDSSSPKAPAPLPTPGSKRHRRRGSKNGRKNAASAKQNNFLFSHD